MFHFFKYITVALMSMSIMKASMINIPLPHGFPKVNFLLAKEMAITEDKWQNIRRINPDGLVPHVLREMQTQLTLKEDERHLLSGFQVLFGRTIIERIGTEKNNPSVAKNGYFHEKQAVGIRINQYLFLKFNTIIWNEKNVADDIISFSICNYLSLLLKTSWLNVDIGFSPDTRLSLEKFKAQTPDEVEEYVKRARVNIEPYLNRIVRTPMFSLPLRINISLNILALGSV